MKLDPKLNNSPHHRPASEPDADTEPTEAPLLSTVTLLPAEHVDYDRRPLAVEHFDHYIDARPTENQRFRVH